MNRPIPEEARATLPKGYVILGWGGEFDVNGFFAGVAFMNGRWHMEVPNYGGHATDLIYAAKEDSEIVKLNERRMLKEVHDELEAEERRGTSEKDFLIAEVKNLEADLEREKKFHEMNVEYWKTRANHFESLYVEERRDRTHYYNLYMDELRRVK